MPDTTPITPFEALTRHRPKEPMAGCDPCGGAYVRDCFCGWLCPPQRLPSEAEALLRQHIRNPAAALIEPSTWTIARPEPADPPILTVADVLPIRLPSLSRGRALVRLLVDTIRRAA